MTGARAAPRVLCVLATFTLAGCGFFPHSGPDYRDIRSGAVASVPSESIGGPLAYAIVDLTARVAALTPDPEVQSIYKSFGGGKGPFPQITVSEGDTLSVTVFESQAGGLFIPAEASVRPGNFVSFPNQTVDSSGHIAVPYAGLVQVTGRSVEKIQDDIRKRLEPRAIQPQVLVSMVSRAAFVSVNGDVNLPNKFTVDYAGDRILDMISKAGGVKYSGWDEYVTLQRRDRKATIFFNRLVNDPKENIFVEMGDTIYIYRQQRFYSIFGAAGTQGRFDFDTEHVYLSDAVGRAIGLADQQANPGEIYLYRLEDRAQLVRTGVDVTAFPPDLVKVPTVYHVNLRQSEGFFLAQRFALQDRDIVYVSNADSYEVSKALSLISSTANTASDITVSTRAAQTLSR